MSMLLGFRIAKEGGKQRLNVYSENCRVLGTKMGRILGTMLMGFFVFYAQTGVAQDAGVSGELQRYAETTDDEKKMYVSDAISEMSDGIKQVERLLDSSKKKKDENETTCIASRLTQMRALSQVTEMAQIALSEASAAANSERSDHEFRKTAVALSKSRQLRVEAEACVGQSRTRSGETKVTIVGALESEEDELQAPFYDLLELGVDPPLVSPYL